MRNRNNGEFTNVEKERRRALARYAKAFSEGYQQTSKLRASLHSFSGSGLDQLNQLGPSKVNLMNHPAYGLDKGKRAGAVALWAGVHLGDFK
jgi:hypothetical protein